MMAHCNKNTDKYFTQHIPCPRISSFVCFQFSDKLAIRLQNPTNTYVNDREKAEI